MFTKEDYVEYFGQLAVIEREMIYRLEDDLSVVEDSHIRTLLERIRQDECRHYAAIIDILETILFRKEKRSAVGIHSLGPAEIVQADKAHSARGYCIHISKDALYIELEELPSFQGEVEVSLNLIGAEDEKRHHEGRVEWISRITPRVSMLKVACPPLFRS